MVSETSQEMKVEDVEEALIDERVRAGARAARRRRSRAGRGVRAAVLPLGVARRPRRAHAARPLRRGARATSTSPAMRTPGTPKVRVYNPQFEEHGWQSTHTAVEIVTDDMPFLIDSVSMELNRRGFGVHLIIHPVHERPPRRERRARRRSCRPSPDRPRRARSRESVIHAEVDRQTDPAELDELAAATCVRVIGEVRAAVEDWPAMRSRALEIGGRARRQAPPPATPRGRRRGAARSSPGSRTTTSRSSATATTTSPTRTASCGSRRSPGSGLGILRQPSERRAPRGFDELPPEVRERGARAVPAQPDQGELARDRAPAGVPRLRGRQALRRRGHG